MNPEISWLAHHQAILGAAGVWIFSSLVSSMPAPKPSASTGYLWLYKFLQTLSGSMKQVNLSQREDVEVPAPSTQTKAN